MALVVAASNTQSPAVVGTEHTLYTETGTTPTFYVLEADLTAMVEAATPDIVEFRIYAITLTGGTERLTRLVPYVGAPDEKIVRSEPIPADVANSPRFTLKQTQGSSRDIPWKVWAF